MHLISWFNFYMKTMQQYNDSNVRTVDKWCRYNRSQTKAVVLWSVFLNPLNCMCFTAFLVSVCSKCLLNISTVLYIVGEQHTVHLSLFPPIDI